MKIDWDRDIQELTALKRMVSESEGVSFSAPRPPATEAELIAVEEHLGLSLDRQFRDFLQHANGWDDFYISTSLFGTGELCDSAGLMATATECVAAYGEFNPSGMLPPDDAPAEQWQLQSPLDTISPKDLLPIGFSTSIGSITVIGRERTSCAGQVLEFSGSTIDRYPDFLAFFQSVIEYERSRIQ